MPLPYDIMSRVTNVQWGGLAVEVADGDNFLNSAEAIVKDSAKVVISIWFRIPKESMDAVLSKTKAPFNPEGGPPPSAFLWGALPIITWGPTDLKNGSAYTSCSYIGLALNANVIDLSNQAWGLAFNLQFTTEGTNTTDDPGLDFTTGFPENISFGLVYNNNSFWGKGSGNDKFAVNPIEVTPAAWHHLLISWDISKPIRTSNALNPGDPTDDLSPGIASAATIYVALDDVNISGIKNFWPCGGYVDGNGFITVNGFLSAREAKPGAEGEGGGDPTSFSWIPSSPIPMGVYPFGLPTAGLTENNYHCELAEFQMFTGVTLDISKEDNRGVFIDPEGKPVDPAKAEELLGKPPVLLHGSGNWKSGNNTGSSDGKFEPTGKIKAYHPDPSLHGEQGE